MAFEGVGFGGVGFEGVALVLALGLVFGSGVTSLAFCAWLVLLVSIDGVGVTVPLTPSEACSLPANAA